jgi:hypothetical protein
MLLAIDVASVLCAAVILLGRTAQAMPIWLVAYLAACLVRANAKTGQYRAEIPALADRLKNSAKALALLATAVALPLYFGRMVTESALGVFGGLTLLHVVSRGVAANAGRTHALLRLLIMIGSVAYLWGPFLGSFRPGSGDAYWYQLMLGDFVAQWRAGAFPAFVGQSDQAFSGTVFPHRFAPLFQHTAGILDLVTGSQLTYSALLSLTLLLAAMGGAWSVHRCMQAILPGQPWTQLALALLFMASPGVLSLAYTGSLYMSVMTLPLIPWIILGIWRASCIREPLPILSIAAPLAAAWFGHPPIAFWLSLLLAGALLTRWILLRREPRQAALEAAKLLLVFVPLAAFVFISVLSLETGEKLASVRAITRSIDGSFPGTLLPISPLAALDSDYQVGLSVLVFGVIAVVAWYRQPDPTGTFLVGGMLGLLVLLFPVPGVTTWIWNQLPQLVLEATYNWPMQRLTVIALALSVTAIAWALARWSSQRPLPVAVIIALWIGVAWSHWEARRFVGRATTNMVPATRADSKLDPHNATITRYSFFQLTNAPHYFSHGYVDPALTPRLLSADGKNVVESNRAAVERRAPVTSTPLSGTLDIAGAVSLRPLLSLSPGVRHYLSVEWQGPTAEIKGTLSTYAQTIDRVYWLPDSAFGSVFTTTNESFGIGKQHAAGFSMWTTNPEPEQVEIRFTYLPKPTTPPPTHFLTLHDRTYTAEDLPIKLHSLVPLRVSAVSPEGGSLLETPRMFVDGYAAKVNGRQVDVVITRDRLVGVPLPAGPVEVELTYEGTALLRGSYAVALLGWILVLAIPAIVWVRRRRSAPTATPA